MITSGLIALLSCPVITPSYEATPAVPITQALRIGTQVTSKNLAPDDQGNITVEVTSSGAGEKPTEVKIPKKCFATKVDFKKVRSWSSKNKYSFCVGEYCPSFEIRKNGTALSTIPLCIEGNCVPGKKYSVKEDCLGGRIVGKNCYLQYDLLQAGDLFKLERKGAKHDGDDAYFMLDHNNHPKSLFPKN